KQKAGANAPAFNYSIKNRLFSSSACFFALRNRVGFVTISFFECLANTCFIVWMHQLEMTQLTLDDEARNALHCRGNIGEKTLLLAVIKQIKQCTWLRIIVVSNTMIVTIGIAADAQWRFFC